MKFNLALCTRVGFSKRTQVEMVIIYQYQREGDRTGQTFTPIYFQT